MDPLLPYLLRETSSIYVPGEHHVQHVLVHCGFVVLAGRDPGDRVWGRHLLSEGQEVIQSLLPPLWILHTPQSAEQQRNPVK